MNCNLIFFRFHTQCRFWGISFCVNYVSLSGGARAVESCIRRVTFCVCSCRETYTDYQSECKETYEEETEEEGASSASLLFSVSATPSFSLLPLPPPPLSPPQVLPPSVMSLNHISAQITSGFSIFIILTYDHDTNILKPILLRFLLKFEKKYLLEIKIRRKCVFILRLIKWMCKGTINLLFFKYSVISGWYTIIILLNISLLMFVTKQYQL